MKSIREVAPNLLLLAITLLFCAAIAELQLRLFAPRYEYAARSMVDPHVSRIWSPVPGSTSTWRHPDDPTHHLVIHNNLSFRQHRYISPDKPTGEIRIGLFGDSFTENLRVAAPYSFSEVLDYLLRLHGPHYSVLNFGVDGYGTDQSYLAYVESPAARDLDVVLYIFCHNDLRNLYENGLFDLDERGELVRTRPPESRVPVFVRRLYLTYFLLDIFERARIHWERHDASVVVDPLRAQRDARLQVRRDWEGRFHDATADGIQNEVDSGPRGKLVERYAALLRALVDRWEQVVRSQNGHFLVVLLPITPEGFDAWLFNGHDVVDLAAEFATSGVSEREWRFRNDGHWNETGNLIAALRLFRRLEKELGLEPLRDDSVRRALFQYYRSFDDGYVPALWVEPTSSSADRERAIRERYVALEEP